MLTLLFWNARRENASTQASLASQRRVRIIGDAIAALATTHSIDVLIFAELQLPSSQVIQKLGITTGQDYMEAEADGICDKIRIFARHPNSCLAMPQASGALYRARDDNATASKPVAGGCAFAG